MNVMLWSILVIKGLVFWSLRRLHYVGKTSFWRFFADVLWTSCNWRRRWFQRWPCTDVNMTSAKVMKGRHDDVIHRGTACGRLRRSPLSPGTRPSTAGRSLAGYTASPTQRVTFTATTLSTAARVTLGISGTRRTLSVMRGWGNAISIGL